MAFRRGLCQSFVLFYMLSHPCSLGITEGATRFSQAPLPNDLCLGSVHRDTWRRFVYGRKFEQQVFLTRFLLEQHLQQKLQLFYIPKSPTNIMLRMGTSARTPPITRSSKSLKLVSPPPPQASSVPRVVGASCSW